jgi:3-oxoacyl-[acyl-carrier protein] reductase
VLPYLLKQKRGRVIKITSLTAEQSVDDLIVFSTVRPGILWLSKILASQYGKNGITFKNVTAAYIRTARQEEIAASSAWSKKASIQRYVDDLTRDVPLARYGTPDELAHVVVFLGSEWASYVNGATNIVDGGLVKGLF